MEDLEFARKQWLQEEPVYASFGEYLEARLQRVVRAVGIPASVSVRTKEIDSLLKKLIRKPDHSYASVGDKLGARIIVKRLGQIQVICEAVAHEFTCGTFENTADRLAEDQVGYLSIHVDVALLPSDPRSGDFPPTAFRAELQVRTLAQNLWSEMAHDTSYKSAIVVHQELKRRLHLLAALIEVSDNEYDRVEDQIANLPDMPELQVLHALERQYYKLASRPGDPELSLRVIRLLWPLYEQTPAELNARFEELFAQHHDELREVFSQAEQTAVDRSAFFFQPEVLMIYDQLAAMPYRVRSRWAQEFPEQELERIAIRFGFPSA
jgi:ppGpp synthetase/RelA/SpoT-type nucleotidyltranferase